MANAHYSTTATARCVLGLAGTGKTAYLVEQIGGLMQKGTAAKDVIVFAATPSACAAFAQRLTDALPDKAPLPRITTLFEFELELLGTPEGIAFTGRMPHLLLRYEENILLEDMKTSGIHPKRLAEMLKFFYRSWTELEPMTSDWFFSDEEENAHRLLQQYLEHYGAYLEAEMGNKAFHLLQHRVEEGRALRIPHVFVDDYQTLTKASQCVASLLAGKTLTVAGDAVAKVRAMESFPYPNGLREFREQNPACETIEMDTSHASRAVVEALNALLADEALDAPALLGRIDAHKEAFRTLSFARPSQEFKGVAALVGSEIAQGVPPESILIATTKPLWSRNIVKALAENGIDASLAERTCIAGDFRTAESSIEARMVTLLKLVSNPCDQLALRCWCAFGDYLANSGVFAQASKRKRSLSLACPTICASEGDALSEKEGAKVVSSLQEAAAIVARAKHLRGMPLLEELVCAVRTGSDRAGKPSVPAPILSSIGQIDKAATAADMVRAIEQSAFAPRFAPHGVRVGSLEDFAGMNAKTLIVSGLVNGFIPARSYFDPTVIERDKRPSLLGKAMGKVYNCMGKAADALYLTYFTEAPLADAERLQLKIERVRLRNGERVCEIHPSETIRSITGVFFHE